MRSGRIVSLLFLAALTALFVWAVLTGVFRDFLSDSARFFGIENPVRATVPDGEDVLFDDDSTLDWSDLITDVFDPSSQSEAEPTDEDTSEETADDPKEKFYELALTPQYFNALLQKYSGDFLRNVESSFAGGQVILSGDVKISALCERLKVSPALVIFLPETVPCTLSCTPKVSEGRMTVAVTKVSSKNDLVTPFLCRAEILSGVEDFLNEQLTRYLSSDYIMQSVRVTDSGMIVRFSMQ
ncbi:MAG: hypothetical protein II348_00745 [Clostridia bacterium]|nr:hypothetical protein [Clostridia bacterium]